MSTTLEEAKKLNDKNLLAFYKAERKRVFQYVASQVCDCCGMWNWETNKYTPNESTEVKRRREFLHLVKQELETRGHVKRK